MIYHQLFQGQKEQRVVKAGVIGAGEFATAVITKSRTIARLEILVIADINPDAARKAFKGAGFADDDIATCSSAKAALKAMETGKRVILEDPLDMMGLPIDVVVESTGVYDAAARHAMEAIKSGKHVTMVSKEADCTVGPILKRMADAQGVVYSTGDGDQPGLLIGLVGWARELGLEVVSCGKSRDLEFLFNDAGDEIRYHTTGRTMALDAHGREIFSPIPTGQAGKIAAERRAYAGKLGRIEGFDIAEMILVGNACEGLVPDCESMVCPIVRSTEIAQVLCPESEGGILKNRGVIDAVTCLRHPSELGQGGGVFIVVSTDDKYSRAELNTIGNANDTKTAFALVRPYHLCGVETGMSVLCAGLLGTPTGASTYEQRYDLVAYANTPLKAGYVISHRVDDHEGNFDFLIRPATPVQEKNPIPFYLAQGRALTRDMAVGEILTPAFIEAPRESTIWNLRREQDLFTFQKKARE